MKKRVTVISSLTFLTVLLHSLPAAADVPPPIGPIVVLATGFLVGGVLFVLVVSGISVALLRRIARKRADDAAKRDAACGSDKQNATDSAPATKEPHDED